MRSRIFGLELCQTFQAAERRATFQSPSSVNATTTDRNKKEAARTFEHTPKAGRLIRIQARGGVIVRRVVHAPALAPKKGFASIETRMRALPTLLAHFSDDSSAFCVHTTQKPRVEGGTACILHTRS